MDSLGRHRGAPAVLVEIDQTNVGRRISDPLENRVLAFQGVIVQLRPEVKPGNRLDELPQQAMRVTIEANADERERPAFGGPLLRRSVKCLFRCHTAD